MTERPDPYKSELEIPELLSLVEKALGSSVTDHWPLAHGEVNQMKAMRLACGQKIVVRISPTEKGWDGFKQEAWAFDACRKAGIPVPEVLYLDTDKNLFPESCIILSMLPGVNGSRLSLSSEDAAIVCHDLGRLLRQMHEISVPKFGQLSMQEGMLKGVHQSLAALCIYEFTEGWWPTEALNKELVSKHQLELALEFIDRHQEHFSGESGSLVHSDIYLDNVLVDPVSCKITGIVDFENVESHDPLMDLRYFLYPPGDDNPPFEALCEGYGRSPVLNQAEQARILVCRCIGAAGNLVYYHRRGLEALVNANRDELQQIFLLLEQGLAGLE